MTTITNIDEYTVTGKFDIAGSIKASEDTTESKNFTLRVSMNNTSLRDVVSKALQPTKISWANGPGRRGFEKMVSGSVIEIDFASPAKKVKSRDEQIEENRAKLAMIPNPDGTPKFTAEEALEMATLIYDNPAIVQAEKAE